MPTRPLAEVIGGVVGSALLMLSGAVPGSGEGLDVAVAWRGSPEAWATMGAGDGDYVVRPGDTLWGVAGELLGDPYRWPEIAALSKRIVQRDGSRLTDPGFIRPGWTLELPPPRIGRGEIASAVLTGSDWADIQRGGVGYPELADVMERDTADGARRLQMMLFTPDEIREAESDQAASTQEGPPPDVAEAGIVTTSAATFIDAQSLGEFPVAGSQVVLLRDESRAAAALQLAIDEALAAPGGKVFDVPGVEGAIGVRHWTPNIGDFVGYTWNVYFTHGPALARVFIAGGPDDERFVEDEADANRNGRWVVDAAESLAERMDRFLGRATTHAPVPSPPAVTEQGSTGVDTSPVVKRRPATIDVGSDRTCALGSDGRAWCWGEAGVASRDGAPESGGDLTPPTEVPESPLFVEISADGRQVCGLDPTGQVWCWGVNGWGLVAGGRSFSGLFGDCAVEATGAAWCWGDGEARPLEIVGAHTVEAIAAGRHTCVLAGAGQAWCWGYNEFGQLGNGSLGDAAVATPVAVAGGHAFVQIAVGDEHTCALDVSGQAWCWGFSSDGALGEGTANAGPDKTVPVPVAGGHTFTAIDVGYGFTCGIDAGSRAWCWGRAGAPLGVGDGATTITFEPVPVSGGHEFAALSVGDGTACAVDTAGRAWCWGDDQSGQLGQGEAGTSACTSEDEIPCSRTPIAVIGSQRFWTP